MAKYFRNDPDEKDVDLIYNFVNSLENRQYHKVEKLPNDPVAMIFTAGVSYILVVMLFNMLKKN
tara:strand:- start:1173 stop:1364 length:192 start_codon:yes stop_codon:yes gene_type:complete